MALNKARAWGNGIMIKELQTLSGPPVLAVVVCGETAVKLKNGSVDSSSAPPLSQPLADE